MSKRLFVMAAILLSFSITSWAQNPLFTLETDTVCPKQPVNIISHAPAGAASYYWGFCSGYLKMIPKETNFGSGHGYYKPADIEVTKQNGNYIGFLVDNETDSLYRLEFGNKLSHAPIVTNLGTLNNTIPNESQGCHLVYDSVTTRWYLFIVGGNTAGTSNLTRVDFGNNLMNTPNVNNMGNLFSQFGAPSAIQVLKNNGEWYGFLTNTVTNEIQRLDFGTNIQQTPTIASIGNVGTLDGVGDMTAVMDDDGTWYLAVVNYNSSTMSVLNFGTDLSSTPTGTNLGDFTGKLFNPTGINYIRDCGKRYFFITNELSGDVLRVNIADMATLNFTTQSVFLATPLSKPSGISNIIRDQDSLFAYVTNAGDSSITELKFEQCKNTNIQSSDKIQPPSFSYNAPGTYNIYFVMNEGLPNMTIYCRDIVVSPYPGITINADTILCQGDSTYLTVLSPEALEFSWYPENKIDTIKGRTVRVWPDYGTYYHVVMSYDNGCVVDTAVFIDVIKNKADAGEDRVISDGSTTMLGGPGTSIGSEYSYRWFPDDYLDEWDKPVVKSTPLGNITYYLQIMTTQKGYTCTDIDTVVVKSICDNLNLPNAFAPLDPEPGVARFGLLNKNILKLNRFQVFDRWGKIVFETTNPQETWDGTFNGKPCAMGVYVWQVDAFCHEGQRFSKSGNVTLIR